MHFSELDIDRYPVMTLIREALNKSDGAIIALSSADEVLVEKFLADKIKFNDIYKNLEKVYLKFQNIKDASVDDVLKISYEAKEYAKTLR